MPHGARCCFYNWATVDRRYPPPFGWFEQYAFRHAAHAIAGVQEAAEIMRLTREQVQRARVVLWRGHCSVHGRFSADVVGLVMIRTVTYGVIGIKVWVFKGEVMPHNAEPQAAPEPAPEAPKRASAPPRT